MSTLCIDSIEQNPNELSRVEDEDEDAEKISKEAHWLSLHTIRLKPHKTSLISLDWFNSSRFKRSSFHPVEIFSINENSMGSSMGSAQDFILA